METCTCAGTHQLTHRQNPSGARFQPGVWPCGVSSPRGGCSQSIPKLPGCSSPSQAPCCLVLGLGTASTTAARTAQPFLLYRLEPEHSTTAWKQRKMHLPRARQRRAPQHQPLAGEPPISPAASRRHTAAVVFCKVASLPFVTVTKSQPWRGAAICGIQTH